MEQATISVMGGGVIYAGRLPEPETHVDRVNRCRPTSRWSRHIALALSVAQQEKPLAEERIAWARRERAQFLAAGQIAKVQAVDARIATLEIELEQFTEIVAKLGRDVLEAEAEEERAGLHLQHLANEVETAATPFRKWLENEYPKLARAIAKGLELGLSLDRAVAALHQAQDQHPNAPRPAVVQVPRLNGAVVLPGVNGEAAFVAETKRNRHQAAGSVYGR